MCRYTGELQMGLLKKLKNSIPSRGEPESNIRASDFDDLENSGGGDDEGDNSSDGEEQDEQEDNGSGGENEQDNQEENGSGGNDEDSEEGDEQDNEEDNGSGGNDQDDGQDDDQDGEENGSGGDNEDSEEGEEQDEDGGNSNNNNDGDKQDDSELEDLQSEMERSSRERDMSNWADTEEDYEDPSKFIKNFYEQVQEDRAEPETEIDKRRSERDERINEVNNEVTVDMLREEYEKRFADEISEAFRKIKTREAPQPAEHGQRINMRGVVRKRSGDPTEERLYLEMDDSEVGDRCVTVVVDSSGSMDELEIKLALLALADATEQIGDRFTATSYYTSTIGWDVDETHTDLITAPTENFEIEHTKSFNAKGFTPTAHGIEDGRSLSDITPNSEDVIIVITDGVANIDLSGSKHTQSTHNTPMEQASDQVNTAINEGKRVIGMGVGEDITNEDMKKIFGNNYVRADMGQIADRLVEIYRRQMETVDH